MSATAAVLLAAGRSRRMGAVDKRLLPLGTRPLLAWSLEAFLAAGFHSVGLVVTAEDRARLAPALKGVAGAFHWVTVASTQGGLADTLAAGATAAALASPNRALAVGLADMPFLGPDLLRTLKDRADSLSPDQILRPTYGSVPGHPVIFGPAHGQALTALKGETGARDYLKANRKNLVAIPVGDAAVIRDVDTPSAYEAAKALFDGTQGRPKAPKTPL